MNKWLVTLILIQLLYLVGCGNFVNNGMIREKPPKVILEIGKETYDTTLGSYCWKGVCRDTAGPVELLEGKETIKVKPGENVKLVMNVEPKPNEIHVYQINENMEENEVMVKNNQFTAPTKKGVYYYSYGVWWMDEKEENLSHGDAFYAFVLEFN